MAITKDDLQITVTVDADGAVKSLKATGKAVAELDEEIKKANRSAQAFSKSLDFAAKANKAILKNLTSTALGLVTLDKSTQQVTDSYDDLSSASASAASSLAAGGLVTAIRQVAKNSEKLRDTFEDMGKSVDATFSTMSNSASKLKSKFTASFAGIAKSRTSIIKVTEAAFVASPILLAMGTAFKASENASVRFAGNLAILGALLVGGFAAAVGIALRAIGDLASTIGDKLIQAMAGFEAKALKTEQIISQFRFTVLGFNKVFGESVGTLEQWESVVQDIADNSTLGFNDITKSIKLVIAEGNALGLTYQQNFDLVKRATDVAAASGNTLTDTMQRLLSALVGNASAALSLGIDTRQAALAHTELVKASGLAVTSLDEESLVAARLAAIMERTAPIIGAAAAETETIAGASATLDRTLDSLGARLGEQSQLTRAYFETLTGLANIFLTLPEPILRVVGASQDFLGVSLKIIGVLLKYTLTIAGVVTAYKLLQGFIAGSAVAQAALTSTFAVAGRAVGVQTVAVTGLSGAYANLALITKGALTQALVGLAQGIASVTLAISKNTLALLSNPLFLKAAALAAAIFLVIKAFQQIEEETKIFSKALDALKKVIGDVSGVTETFGKVLSGLAGIFSGALTVAIQGTVVVIAGLVGGISKMISSFAKLASFIPGLSDDFKNKLNKAMKSTNELSKEMAEVALRAAGRIGDIFSGVAKANDAVESLKKSVKDPALKKPLEDISKGMSDFDRRVKQAIDSVKTLLLNLKKQKIQFEILKLSGVDSPEALAKTLGLTKKIRLADLVEKKKELEILFKGKPSAELQKGIDAITAQIDVAAKSFDFKFAADTLAPVKAQIDAITTQMETQGMNRVELIEFATQKELRLLEAKRKTLELAGTLTVAGAAELNTAELLIKKQGELNAAKAKKEAGGEVGLALTAGKDALAGAAAGFMGSINAASGLMSVAQGVLAAGPALINQAADLINMITDFPSVLASAFENLDQALLGLANNFVDNLADGLPRIISSIVNSFVTLFVRIPAMIIKLAMDLPGIIIDSLIAGLDTLITAIKDIFSGGLFGGGGDELAESVGKAGQKAGEAIQGSSDKLFAVTEANSKASGMSTADKIREAIGSSTRSAGGFLSRIWDGFLSALKAVWGFIKKFIIDPFVMVLKVVWEDVVKPIVDLLVYAFKALWEDIISPIVDLLVDYFKFIWEDVISPIVDIMVDGFKVLWENVISPIVDLLVTSFKFVWEVVIKPIVDLLVFTFKFIWEKVVKPIVDILVTSFQTVWEKIIKPIVTLFVTVFKSIWTKVIKPLWENVIGPLLKGFVKGITIAWEFVRDNIVEPLTEGIKAAWNFVNENIIEPFMSGLRAVFAFVKETIIDPISELIEAFTGGVEGIGDSIQGGIESVGDFIGGIFGNTGGVATPAGFMAQGGPALMNPKGVDTIPAMLQPGEFVMSRPAVNAIGVDTLREMNSGRTAGGGTQNVVMNFDLKIETTEPIDERTIRNKIIPAVKKDLKRASLDGAFVMSKGGLR